MASKVPASPGSPKRAHASVDSLNRRLTPSSNDSSPQRTLLTPDLESGYSVGATKLSRTTTILLVASGVVLLLLAATSYSTVHGYRKEAESLRVHLDLQNQALEENSKQVAQHKEDLALQKAELELHRAEVQMHKALEEKQQHMLAQQRHAVQHLQQEQLLKKLPEVEDFDRAAAATSPVGQLLANLAAAGQDVRALERKLGTVLSWKHNLPVPDLVRSNAFMGNGGRLRRVVRDLLAGDKEIRIGVVGGSISWWVVALCCVVHCSAVLTLPVCWCWPAPPASSACLRAGCAMPAWPCAQTWPEGSKMQWVAWQPASCKQGLGPRCAGGIVHMT
jgi:hypothetical protein